MLYTLITNLSILKTASLYRKTSINIYKYNKTFIKILNILYKEGFIKSFLIIDTNNDKYIRIFLNYSSDTSWGLIDSLKIVSKSSLNVNLKYLDLCRLQKKKIYYFFSTKKGFLDLNECLKNKVGGKLLFII